MVDGDVNQGFVGWARVLWVGSIFVSLKEGWEPQGML